MIFWVLGLAALLVAAFAAFAFWRRWVEPWQEIEELVTAIVHRQAPRKFLTTANERANVIGLALEEFAGKRRELERRASEGTAGLENILGALSVGVAVVDEERRLHLHNPRFSQLFGATETGSTLLEAVRDAQVDRAVASALANGEERKEALVLTRAGERSDVEVTAVPFRATKEGEPGAIVLFRDVTQMRQVEQMRKDFVANVSHELRTPLSIFRGYLETLLDDPVQPREELIRILEVMDRHADRLTLLVEDILSLAQLETPGARLEPTEIYLPEFLSGILRDWEKRLGTKLLQASLEAPEGLPVISADEHRLQEVIYNLLDNAVKYSQPEGRIVLGAAREDDSVRFFVSDEGAGIPARDLPRIFERFYRADKARSRQLGGTGLGLSIVKHIAHLHGGRVEAASEPGRGATISVILPLRAPEEILAASENPQQPQLPF